MKSILLILVFLSCPALVSASSQPLTSTDPYFRTDLPKLFASQTHHTPGASVAVMRNGTIVFAGGFGESDLRFGEPIGPTTRFNVGSIAKQFTAFSIYHLMAMKKISADERIRKYIPELPSSMDAVTVQELLWQTSGIRDYIELAAMDGHQLSDAITFKDLLALMQFQTTLNFVPGTEYNYSNTNYALLAEIVHRASGQTFASYVENTIFRPLGMKESAFRDSSGSIIPNLASSYWPSANGAFVDAAGRSDVVGDSNFITTPTDLLKWEGNLMAPRLGSEEIGRMESQGLLKNGTPARKGMGSGLEIGSFKGMTALRFDGGSEGFRADAVAFPQRRLAIAIFTNLISFFPDEQLDAISAHFLGSTPTPTPSVTTSATAPPAKALDVTSLAKYTGAYHSDEIDQTFWICLEGDTLVARHLFGPEVLLTSSGDDAFDGSYWWFQTIKFERSPDNSIRGMDVSGFRAALNVFFIKTGNMCALGVQ